MFLQNWDKVRQGKPRTNGKRIAEGLDGKRIAEGLERKRIAKGLQKDKFDVLSLWHPFAIQFLSYPRKERFLVVLCFRRIYLIYMSFNYH